jgi:hypothetical protein
MSDNGAVKMYYSVNDVRKILKDLSADDKDCYISSYVTGLLERRGAYTDLTLVNGTEVTSLSVNRSRVSASYLDDFRYIPETELQKAFQEVGLDLTAFQTPGASVYAAARPRQINKTNGNKPSVNKETLVSAPTIVEYTLRAGGIVPFMLESGSSFMAIVSNPNLAQSVAYLTWTMTGSSRNPFMPVSKVERALRQVGLQPRPKVKRLHF